MKHRIEAMKLSYLLKHEWDGNPKAHDIEDIKESMRRFGFTAPLLFDEKTKRIVAGHGRLHSLADMKADKEKPPKGIDVDGKDWLVPTIRGLTFKDKVEAAAYVIADNRLTEVGGWDDAALLTMLKDLRESDGLLGTGYSEREVDKLMKLLSTDATVAPEDFKTVDIDVTTHYRCPKCSYEWSGKPK